MLPMKTQPHAWLFETLPESPDRPRRCFEDFETRENIIYKYDIELLCPHQQLQFLQAENSECKARRTQNCGWVSMSPTLKISTPSFEYWGRCERNKKYGGGLRNIQVSMPVIKINETVRLISQNFESQRDSFLA